MNHYNKLLENYDFNAFEVLTALTRKRTLSRVVVFASLEAELFMYRLSCLVSYCSQLQHKFLINIIAPIYSRKPKSTTVGILYIFLFWEKCEYKKKKV
jgi:hypothetical protein